MKIFFELLRDHTMKIINFKNKKLKLLKNSSRNQMKIQKSIIFVKKTLKINISKIKYIEKREIIVVIQENLELLRIEYVF